jgi:hypothetical protein
MGRANKNNISTGIFYYLVFVFIPIFIFIFISEPRVAPEGPAVDLDIEELVCSLYSECVT